MRSHLLAALLTLPALTACTGASADEESATATDAATDAERVEADWRGDVEDALGTGSFDFDAITGQSAADCQRTTPAAWVPTLVMSGDLSTSTTKVTRIGLEHACPEVVEAFDTALAEVETAADPLDLVCGPGVELDAEDALKAELVCASR